MISNIFHKSNSSFGNLTFFKVALLNFHFNHNKYVKIILRIQTTEILKDLFINVACDCILPFLTASL